jgi:hypothetical protein
MISMLACGALSLITTNAGTGPELPSMPSTSSPAEPMLNFQDVALERTRVANGEYRIVEQNQEGGIGFFAPGVYNFRESWTIWRLKDGSFEVEGERSYESPKGELQNNGFHILLSSAFRVLGVKERRKLRWRHDSGPLACDFLSDGIVCSSASSVPDQTFRWNMPAKEPYGFFWPLSAFSLASIARSADRDPTRESEVQLLTLHEPNAAFPVFGTVMDAKLRYSGQEQITAADRQWNAERFELTVSLYSKFVIWVSPEGLLLAFARGTRVKPRSERAMTLVSFQQWTKF